MNDILKMCDDVDDMSYMFYNCSITNIDTKLLNTNNVTNMSYMFCGCSSLTNIDVSGFDTSNVTNMKSMFYHCADLLDIDVSNFNTSNVTNMDSLFNTCKKITSLDLSNFDMSKVNNLNYILYDCSELINLKFGKNLGKGYTNKSTNYFAYPVDLSKSTKLTHDSLMSVINNLYDLNLTYDVANGGTLYRQSLKLGSTNLAKLTAEEIAIATNKGWNVT